MKKRFLSLIVLSFVFMSLSAFWRDKPAEKKESAPAQVPTLVKETVSAEKTEEKSPPIMITATPAAIKKAAQPIVLPKTSNAKLPKTKMTLTKPTVSSAQVRSDIQKIIQTNEKRQKELQAQLAELNQTLVRAKTYNKILTNMYPSGVAKTLADKAVSQEKVKILHEEVKVMAPAATKAVEASRLPIGKNAPKK